MGVIHSKVTAQGRISVPVEVRRQIGIGPGSVLVWEQRDGEFVVRRVGKATSADLHAAVFGDSKPGRRRSTDVKAGIRQYICKRYARD